MNQNHRISIKQILKQRTFAEKCLALLYVVHLMSVLMFVMAFNARVGLSSLNENLKLIVSVILALLSISCFYKRLLWWDYIIVLGIGGFCLWSPNLYPQTTLVVGLFAPEFVFSCLPLYLLGATVRLQEDVDLFAFIGRLGVIVNGVLSLLALLGLTNQFELSEESQGFAYSLLPMVILTAISATKSHARLDWGLTIVGSLLMLSMGARGPIMAMALFVMGYVFLFMHYKNGFASRIVIVFVGGIFLLLIDEIIRILMSITSTFGMNTRVYEMLLGNEIVSTENRDWIYDKVKDELNHNPVYGNGFFYDRTLFGMESDSYAHNIFYEVFLDFGFYIGTALFVAFFGMMIWSMIKYWKTPVSTLLFAFFCGYFVMFIFSGSIFRTPTFWFFIGIVVSTFRSKPHVILDYNINHINNKIHITPVRS